MPFTPLSERHGGAQPVMATPGPPGRMEPAAKIAVDAAENSDEKLVTTVRDPPRVCRGGVTIPDMFTFCGTASGYIRRVVRPDHQELHE